MFRTWLAAAVALIPLVASALAPGDAAPGFEVPGAQGPLRLSDFRGRTVWLDFWASWCGPCRQSFPWMNEMQARYGARGLQVVGINVDRKPADARAFLERTPARFTLGFDPAGNVPRAYAIQAMPTSVLVGPDGRVLLVHNGFRNDERDELERRIREALGQKP